MKRKRNPCEGCVWRLWTGTEKVLCPFGRCRRAEYGIISRRINSHEKTKDDQNRTADKGAV